MYRLDRSQDVPSLIYVPSSTLSLDNQSNFLPIRRQGPKKIRFRENSLESIEKVSVDISWRCVLLKMTSEASQCCVGILAISVRGVPSHEVRVRTSRVLQ
jgi:hypothetical protein